MVVQKGLIKKQFPGQTERYEGKVRVVHTIGQVLVAETTDDISAFDVVLPVTIPNKGMYLNLMAAHFLNATKDIIPNCLLAVPNPRISLWLKVEQFKFELVLRRINTGSYDRDYTSKNKPDPWGYEMVPGMKKFERFPELRVTPTTKAPNGEHDEPITREQIIERGLATAEDYDYIVEKSKEVFMKGEEMAAARGLILADTKYEFGKDSKGQIRLSDEVHTADSSRYFYSENYDELVAKGEAPKELSKEFVRQWLIENGFQGQAGQTMPKFPVGFENNVSARYKELFELLVGPLTEQVGSGYEKFTNDPEILYAQTHAALIKVRPQVEGPRVGILMGSKSDYEKGPMKAVTELLIQSGVTFEMGVVSAHRTPEDVEKYAQNARDRGVQVIIAAAGGAAHLPGMLAANTILPIVAVPVKTEKAVLDGLDALLSELQMPAGVPVGVMAVDGAENASIYALQILATGDAKIAEFLLKHKQELKKKVYGHRDEMAQQFYFDL